MASSVHSGLSPLRRVLENRAVLLAQQNTTTPAVALNVTFTAGSTYESGDRAGLAYLIALAIDRGTESRSGREIAETFDDLGVSLRAWTTPHSFTLSCVCLTEDFESVLELVSDIARRPVFPDDEVDKRRIEAITSVKQDDDNTSVRATLVALELLYGAEHPYGRPLKGTVSSLERITRRDLVDFHAAALVPSAACVTMVGDIAPERAVEAAARCFGSWRAAPVEQVDVPPPPAPRRVIRHAPLPGKPQADIAYGFTAVRRVDPRYYAYWMMNTILGQFGLGGRLADNIRERQGMAYYAYSTLDATVGEGALMIRAGVDPGNVERTLEAIDLEVEALCARGPTPQELEDTRHALAGSVPRMLETNESTAEFLQIAEQFALGLEYDRELPALLARVSMDDVADAAREILRADRAAIGIAGPDAS